MSRKPNTRAQGEALQDIMCVLRNTSSLSSDLFLARAGIEDVNNSIRRFKDHANDVFKTFCAPIGYSGDWETYAQERAVRVPDPLALKIEQYFRTLEATQQREQEIAFSLEQVRLLLRDYDGLLAHVDDYLATFQYILGKYQTAEACPQMGDFPKKMGELLQSASANRKKIATFKDDVQATHLAVLYSSPWP